MNPQKLIFAVCVIISILHLSKGTDVDKQKVFKETDIPSHIKLQDKRTFKILTQSSICLHKNLTSCLSDEEMHYYYFNRCFSDKCSRGDYVCLNDKKGKALHICGQTKPCRKRYRNIIVHKSVPSKSVDVYSMQCPLGHFQANDNICFDTCVKDESITIVSDGTDQRPAIARCSIERNYCNRKGVSVFEIGSDDDVCVHAYHDLNLRCNGKEELMQDCSCQPKCRAGEARVWNGSFICIPDPKKTGSVKDEKDITEGSTKTDSNDQQSVLQTNIIDSAIGDGPSAKGVEIKSKVEDGTHITALIIGFVVVAILLGVAVVLLIYFRKEREVDNLENGIQVEKTNEYKDDHIDVKADITNEDQSSNENSGETANMIEKTEKQIIIKAEGGVVHVGNKYNILTNPDASVNDQESNSEAISENEPLNESQHMDILKEECFNGSTDSGMHTGDGTAGKMMTLKDVL